MNGNDGAQQQGHHADQTGFLGFVHMHLEGRGDDREVTHHRAAHQADTGEES